MIEYTQGLNFRNTDLTTKVYFMKMFCSWKFSLEKYVIVLSLRASLVAQLVKNPPACGRPGFYPWVGKIPWRRTWHPTPVFLPGESPWTEEPLWATVHGVTKSRPRLSDQAQVWIQLTSKKKFFFFFFHKKGKNKKTFLGFKDST